MMKGLLTLASNNQHEVSKHLKTTKEDQKNYHDRHASKSMKELQPGAKVRMQPDADSKTWKAATAIRHYHTPRSHLVQTEDGGNVRRNRQHLQV